MTDKIDLMNADVRLLGIGQLHKLVEQLRDRVDDLSNNEQSKVALVARTFGMTPTQARILLVLVSYDTATYTRLEQALKYGWENYADTRQLASVHMVRLRRKLKPLGVVIKNRRALGYEMESASRKIVLDYLMVETYKTKGDRAWLCQLQASG